MAPIDRHASLHAFFRERVGLTLHDHGVDLTPRAEWYVVEVLAAHAREPLPPDEPLGLRFARTRRAPAGEKARELRALGDTTLVVSGFFGESLRRAAVDPDYYIAIGSAAYGEAGSLLRVAAPRRDLADVLAEMSARFRDLVPALADVSEESAASGLDVLGLYERWLRTGSRACERRLLAEGVALPRDRERPS